MTTCTACAHKHTYLLFCGGAEATVGTQLLVQLLRQALIRWRGVELARTTGLSLLVFVTTTLQRSAMQPKTHSGSGAEHDLHERHVITPARRRHSVPLPPMGVSITPAFICARGTIARKVIHLNQTRFVDEA
jgi:hypothetical protein